MAYKSFILYENNKFSISFVKHCICLKIGLQPSNKLNKVFNTIIRNITLLYLLL